MAFRNVIDQTQNGRVVMVETKLSDGSSVFEIRIYADHDGEMENNYATVDCINIDAANNLFSLLSIESDYILPNG